MTDLGRYEWGAEPLVVPLDVDGAEVLSFDTNARTGWACYQSPQLVGLVGQVFMRFAQRAVHDLPGQLRILVSLRELRVIAAEDGGLSSPALRSLPFARISAAVNRPDVVSNLRDHLPAEAPGLPTETFPGSPQSGWILGPVNSVGFRPDLEIPIPDGRSRRPDSFYELVARRYLDQASISDRAAIDLAEANGVPVSTVHRWLKEARTRGLLRLPRHRSAADA